MSDESIRSTDEPAAATGGEESGATAAPPRNSTTPNKDETGYESECSTSSRSEADVAYSVLEIEADAYTRFIERQRMDVMYELRRLRLGERPVTGQPNRERIETFINTIHENQQEPARIPSRRPPVPSAHMADINSLASRRCVSAALTSVAFRQDLENTIRQSIGLRTPAPAPPLTPATTPVVPTARVVPQAPPLPLNTPSVPSPVNVEQTQTEILTTPVPTPAVLVPSAHIQQGPIPLALNIERQARELSAWQAITQLQRETIIVEISDLVHRQLVTSALESDFRRHLEHNVLRRFEQGVPADAINAIPLAPPAPRVAPVVAALPARPIPPQHPVPPTSQTRLTVATVDELSSRLDTMQQMLQLMFNMQIDMQRSIRQEVASALTNTRNPAATTVAAPVANHPVDSGQCTVCLTAAADTVLYRCGHLCVCYTCGLHLQQARRVEIVKCPVCRAPVDDILRVYRSSRDTE